MQKSYGIKISSKKDALKLIIILTLFIAIVTLVVKTATAPKPVSIMLSSFLITAAQSAR